jgi:hypothetical protein
MPKQRTPPQPISAAVQETGEKIAEAIGNGDIECLRVLGCKTKYWVPSVSIPNHRYAVHITIKGSSCDCPQKHKCKHIVALQRAMKMFKRL